MSLVGKYVSRENNSTVTVTEANDANGEAKGVFTLDSIEIPVKIHYHFENNVGPATNLWMAGNKDNPNEYVGGAGSTDNRGYSSIRIAGGYPDGPGVRVFEGDYIRE